MNGAFGKRKRHLLTLKIVYRLWNLSANSGLSQWAGNGTLPDSFRKPDFVVPPSTFHHQPTLLGIPEPEKLSVMLQYEQRQCKTRRQRWQEEESHRKREQTRGE
jgi:hypothetical protein